MKTIYQLFLAVTLSVCSMSVFAYVGPGAGLTAIGSVIAFLGAILLLIIGFFWYPIKRLIKRKKESAIEDEPISEIDPDKPE